MTDMPFAGKTLFEHLLRGVVGIAAIIYSIKIGMRLPLLSMGLGGLALLVLRGCPMC